MVVRTARTFVYGDFFLGKKPRSLPPLPGTQPFALEILREFSTTEFVGKLFARAGNSWQPSTGGGLGNYPWYQIYQKASAAHGGAKLPLYFDMEGSGPWQVQHLRDESDDSGPYIAVALKFGSPAT
jgi:hypothetical protein